MVGYGADRGIIPCACEELFKRITNNENKDIQFKVETSMLEIYNEKVLYKKAQTFFSIF